MLDQEKADLRAQQKALKREHLQLLRDRKAKEVKIDELEARAHDVQMLKFGQVRGDDREEHACVMYSFLPSKTYFQPINYILGLLVALYHLLAMVHSFTSKHAAPLPCCMVAPSGD